MAQGDCEFVFPLRVRFSSDVEPRRGVNTDQAVIAGCKCTATTYAYGTKFMVVLHVRPVLEGGAKVYAHMVLLDKTGSPVHKTTWHAAGHLVTAHKDFLKANCVVDNHFVVQCSLRVPWTPPAVEKKIPDLGHDLAILFWNIELTDVSFHVGGKIFGAHRVVLAARSPVFRAELYGPMAESKMPSITIKDMHAYTFYTMLYYMYHGSLPDNFRVRVYSQHILVAADRYKIEGLKKSCEDKLCAKGITVANVVCMLELAEEHVCSKLKNMCLDFLAVDENFKMFATSNEYLRLKQRFPNLLVELQNKFKIALE